MSNTEKNRIHRIQGTEPLAYQVRDREGGKGLFHPHRRGLEAQGRQRIQHSDRIGSARRPHHASRRHREEGLIRNRSGGQSCPPAFFNEQ